MRSIPVIDESSIALARSYEGIADWLLLDSYESGDRQIGALGVTHSWELDRRIIESVHIPAIIAGGLGPENVKEAIRVARPAGVDSKTKTDNSDGSHTKDLQKVAAFVSEKLSTIEGVLSTATHFLLRSYKEQGFLMDIPAEDNNRLKVAP